jgi:hypothetical protein
MYFTCSERVLGPEWDPICIPLGMGYLAMNLCICTHQISRVLRWNGNVSASYGFDILICQAWLSQTAMHDRWT